MSHVCTELSPPAGQVQPFFKRTLQAALKRHRRTAKMGSCDRADQVAHRHLVYLLISLVMSLISTRKSTQAKGKVLIIQEETRLLLPGAAHSAKVTQSPPTHNRPRNRGFCFIGPLLFLKPTSQEAEQASSSVMQHHETPKNGNKLNKFWN